MTSVDSSDFSPSRPSFPANVNGGSVVFGLQVTPDAASRLAQTNPEELIKLAAQIDKNQFEYCLAGDKYRHEQATKKSENETKLAEKKLEHLFMNSQRNRWVLCGLGVAAVVIFISCLVYVGMTKDSKLVEYLVDKLLPFLAALGGGLGGGFGWRAYQEQQRKSME